MTEYRRAKRRQVARAIDVVDTMTDIVVGQLSNLSESGMLLILHQPLGSDSLYQFRFRLNDVDDRGRTIEVGAHELWTDDANANGQYWTGFRFVDVAPDDVGHIRDWVEMPGGKYV